jgi:hypothetical protein
MLLCLQTAHAQEETTDTATPAADEAEDDADAVDTKSILEFVGTGNVQRSLDNGDALPASTGLGVILDESHADAPLLGLIDRVRFSGQINVANTEDSLTIEYDENGLVEPSQLGDAIMTPLVGRRAADLDLMVFFNGDKIPWIFSGINIRYTGSNRLVSDTSESVKATMNAIRVRVFHDLLGSEYRKNYNVLIGVGYAYNSIRGDIGLADRDALRERVLGTKTKSFTGLEIFAQFRIKNIKAEFSYTILDVGGSVPGISQGRMVTTVSFVGGFPVKLK